ncbi:hypothetical protein [Salipiger sp.]|uniref:hypothetical protein n=1 Tax=Salipiger sp. TaxID=2078585 RepID=UPI003A97F438
MSPTDPATLSRAFIADEGKDTTQRFWAMKHHRIKPIAAKLGWVLEPKERIAFYRLFLRRTKIAPAVPQGEFPLLIEGWSQLAPHMTGPGPLPFRRLTGLYLFGFDAAGSGPRAPSRCHLQGRL